MGEFMKRNNFVKALAFTALSLVITACGGSDPSPVPIYGQTNIPAGCPMPQGQFQRVVRGNLTGGATITLNIYDVGNSAVEAYGVLSVPSVERLYSDYSSLPTSYYPTYPYATNPYYGTPGVTQPIAATPGNTAIQRCVSTQGYQGTLDSGTVYEDIEMVVRGPGVYFEMGSKGMPSTWIDGTSIRGWSMLQLDNRGYLEMYLP
jgi:hypothetical protein